MKKIWNWYWWEDSQKTFLTMKGIMTISILVLVMFFGGIGAAVIGFIEIPQCHQGAERQGTTGSYQFPSGCYYRLPDGKELPASEYPAKRLYIETTNRLTVPSQER